MRKYLLSLTLLGTFAVGIAPAYSAVTSSPAERQPVYTTAAYRDHDRYDHRDRDDYYRHHRRHWFYLYLH